MVIMEGRFGSSPFLLPSPSSGILTRMEYWKIGPYSTSEMHSICSVWSNQDLFELFHLLWLNASKRELNFFRFPELFVAHVEAHLMSWFPWGCANFLPVFNDPISSWTHTANPEKGLHAVTFWGVVSISSNHYVLISSCDDNQRFGTPVM